MQCTIFFYFFVHRSKLLNNDLFLSSDDSDQELKSKRKTEERKTKRERSSKPSEESSSAKKSKTMISPVTPPARVTATELFGEDSDNEESITPAHRPHKTGNIPPLYSYFTRRMAKGYSRQISETKEGKYYVEVKIYNTEEIKKIMPINRWRSAITTIKTKLDDNKESWVHLKEFVKATQNDFKNCAITHMGAYDV